MQVGILAKLSVISSPQFHLPQLDALAWWHAWRSLVVKVGTPNPDRTISLKTAVRNCIKKQKIVAILCLLFRKRRKCSKGFRINIHNYQLMRHYIRYFISGRIILQLIKNIILVGKLNITGSWCVVKSSRQRFRRTELKFLFPKQARFLRWILKRMSLKISYLKN
jgi:hypothetical protein